MNILLFFRTVIHLKLIQLVFQIKNRLKIVNYKDKECGDGVGNCSCHPFIPKYQCYKNESFSFLNITSVFHSWNDIENGMLWAYNLNYMDWLQQKNIYKEDACKWIDKFIEDLPQNKIGLDSYPIALRSINWIKFISQHSDIDRNQLCKWNKSLYSQLHLLEKKLEYHLLGNHLLEDAYACFIGAIYFNETRMFVKAADLLVSQLKEQILSDGAHYEQSPMYHCILLDRLLDCYNFSLNNRRFPNQEQITKNLEDKAVKMLGYLEKILYSDGTFPLFNDSANGIAPMPADLFNYAKRLGIKWQSIDMRESGYRKMQLGEMEAFVDIGNITATYQPGHTHADTFNYELRVRNRPFIVDTGISTYNKTKRRQYERSTSAHNTVSVLHRNSSEVWGGFRVGKRAFVSVKIDKPLLIKASHNGFGKTKIHERTFILNEQTFVIQDVITTEDEAISYIHLSNTVIIENYSNDFVKTNIAIIYLKGAIQVNIVDDFVSEEYNVFKPIVKIEIYFKKQLTYNIIPS